jgi:phospholipase/carboxylesterase
MIERAFDGIELLPATGQAKQLFILLHGVGGRAADLIPLANRIRGAYPEAVCLLPEGFVPFEGNGAGRQWFSVDGVTEENRPARVAQVMPRLHALVRQAQERFHIVQPDTVLGGFSQGAIMALEYSIAHDGAVGRVLAFSGRFARLPEKAPTLTTLHLLHGSADAMFNVRNVEAAFEWLNQLGGDATLDIASSIGHRLDDALIETALYRLQTTVPLRSWMNALKGI